MTPEEKKAYLYVLREREEAGERATLMIGPWTRALIPGIVWYVTQKGPEPANLAEAEFQALRQREREGERHEQPIGPYAAMLLLRGIQDVVRHDTLFATYGPEMFEGLLDQLKLMFVDDPQGTEIIHEGEKKPRRRDTPG